MKLLFVIAVAILLNTGCEKNPVQNDDDNPYLIPDSSYSCIRPMDCTWKIFGDSLVVKFSPVQPRHTSYIVLLITYPDYETGINFPVKEETGMVVLRYFGVAPAPIEVKAYRQFTCRS